MLEKLLAALGYGLCHQLPERSFVSGGLQIPVCARDTGIYLGFVISALVITALHRDERPEYLPGPGVLALTGLFIGAMAIDGFTSYGGLRTTTNDIRLATGLMAGFAMAALAVPLLNSEAWIAPSRTRVLDDRRMLAAWLSAGVASYFVVRYGAPMLGAAYAMLVALAILTTFTIVNLVLVCMIGPFERSARRWRDLVKPALVALLIGVVEIALGAALRVWLDSLASRL